jgi:hypothetical protein
VLTAGAKSVDCVSCADLMQLDGSPAQSVSNGSPRVAELMSASRPRAAAFSSAPSGERSAERLTGGHGLPIAQSPPTQLSAGRTGEVRDALSSLF